MSDIKKQILEANKSYADGFGDKADLPMPPGRHFSILTCIDARLDPAKFAGLTEGDAHVFRNAGGELRTTRFALWLYRTKCLGHANGSSFTTPTVVWSTSTTQPSLAY